MQSMRLHVVTAVFNPVHWESRPALSGKFVEHMLDSGVHLTVVECAYGDYPWEVPDNPYIVHLKLRAKNALWAKENLLNIGIDSLPPEARFVAWIDADLTFERAHWADATVYALHDYAVVQPWGHAYDLGPNGEPLSTLWTSFCKRFRDGTPITQGDFAPENNGVHPAGKLFGHPGYAWAATRDVLAELGGLLDIGILGSGDHHMAMAMLGRTMHTIHPDVTDGYKLRALAWQDQARASVGERIGYVSGVIHHHWHGQKKKRGYRERWDVLTSNAYDPNHDIVRNDGGVYDFAGNKPKLEREILTYFLSREEDSVIL